MQHNAFVGSLLHSRRNDDSTDNVCQI